MDEFVNAIKAPFVADTPAVRPAVMAAVWFGVGAAVLKLLD